MVLEKDGELNFIPSLSKSFKFPSVSKVSFLGTLALSALLISMFWWFLFVLILINNFLHALHCVCVWQRDRDQGNCCPEICSCQVKGSQSNRWCTWAPPAVVQHNSSHTVRCNLDPANDTYLNHLTNERWKHVCLAIEKCDMIKLIGI